MSVTVYSPTKFDSAAHEVIAILSDEAEGYGRASTGRSEAPTGHVALVFLDDTCDLDVQDTTGAYPVGDEAGEVARTYGVTADDIRGSHLVVENDRGDVTVTTFETPQEAQDAFDCAQARYSAWDAQEDEADAGEESSDGIYVCPVIGHGYHSV